MVTKFGMGDEVGDPYPCAELYYDLIRDFRFPSACRTCCNAYKVTRLVNCFRGFFLFCIDYNDHYVNTVNTKKRLQYDLILDKKKQNFYPPNASAALDRL